MKSKKALAFEKFKFSDPGWNAEGHPRLPEAPAWPFALLPWTNIPAGKCTGSSSLHMPIEVTAEKVCRELNELKARMLATAYP